MGDAVKERKFIERLPERRYVMGGEPRRDLPAKRGAVVIGERLVGRGRASRDGEGERERQGGKAEEALGHGEGAGFFTGSARVAISVFSFSRKAVKGVTPSSPLARERTLTD
jgi:hypothetical protein